MSVVNKRAEVAGEFGRVHLFLIRHAEPQRAVGDTPADPGLTERGREQARKLAAYLAADGVDVVISSPMRRARETAAELARASGTTARVDEMLTEWDAGATSYIPYEELKATRDPALLAFVNDDHDALGFEVGPFRSAAVAAVEGIIAGHKGRRVAVICHSGIVNAYVGHLWRAERLFLHNPDYTGICRIAASGSGVRTVFNLNETTHLHRTGLLVR
jgi:probable phosphoglycerate mutase